MIDVTHEINTTQRHIGSRTLPAGEARVMTIVRTYATTVEDLWDACTNPRRIPRWFLPISGDLRVGGTYQLEGNAGGTVERCDPPRSFAATWEYGGQVSWLEIRLSAAGADQTRFELEHVAHVSDELWAQYGPGATGVGWDLGLLGLGLHLATGEPNDAKTFEAWTLSEEGREFVGRASAAWAHASIDAGTEPAAARAAADRTTAFYTGEAAPG
jgi:uncharacterized protein YndB with AHSA1/START domain